jgi:hypothetical protein
VERAEAMGLAPEPERQAEPAAVKEEEEEAAAAAA